MINIIFNLYNKVSCFTSELRINLIYVQTAKIILEIKNALFICLFFFFSVFQIYEGGPGQNGTPAIFHRLQELSMRDISISNLTRKLKKKSMID